MQITVSQQEIIDNLYVERLSSNENNLRLVTSFLNTKNPTLADTLQNDANMEDLKKLDAYYVIKRKEDDEIVFYFSLRCGQLIDSYFDVKSCEILQEMEKYLRELESNLDSASEVHKQIEEIRENLRTKRGITKKQFDKLPKLGIPIEEQIETLMADSHSPYVFHTYSGIELGHFCKNETYSAWWDDFRMPHSLGEVVFWQFVMDIVAKSVDLIGSQYLFLFAADDTRDQSLVSYYKNRYGFREQNDELNSAQSYYTFDCVFLFNEINQLIKRRVDFYDQFNDKLV